MLTSTGRTSVISHEHKEYTITVKTEYIPDSAKLKIHPLHKMPKIWYNKGIRKAEKQHQKGEEENAENRDSNKR